jgi:hypothetical protein
MPEAAHHSRSHRDNRGVEVPAYQDAFNPVLVKSPRLQTTEEQNLYIQKVLDVSCSDSRFAQKAYGAILLILDGNKPLPTEEVPEGTPLTPKAK